MKKILIFSFIFNGILAYAGDTLQFDSIDTSFIVTEKIQVEKINPPVNIYEERLRILDANSPMDLAYNEKVQVFIDSYLGRNKSLISRMQGLKELYFPLFEQQLDKYNLPLEFKYLAIVESALNPRAKSRSGATGLWQFMYLTGKEFDLEVTSYMDERQDPLKSTQAACKYFLELHAMFGDWNLVLAAYNGGPGYLQRKINSVGSNDFWELYPHLREETRNYVPSFIAVNYAMNYAKEHDISTKTIDINFTKTDTITIKKQVDISTLSQMLSLNKETISYLNPCFKEDIFPINAILVLPTFAINDFLNNEQVNYAFIDSVDAKKLLIDEEQVVYIVKKGDYLGRIAKEYGVKLFELREWNKLENTDLSVGDKLIIYVKKNPEISKQEEKTVINEYIVQPGDTLWGIAQKYEGISVWEIKSLNNLESDTLKPGTKIILPTT